MSFINSLFILLFLLQTTHCQDQPSPATDPETVGNINATGLVVPTNQTADMLPNFTLELKAEDSQLTMSTDLSAMTAVTGKSFSSINGITALCSGTLILMNNTSNLDFSIIPLLPCDDADTVAQYLIDVENSNSPCAVLYSLTGQGCTFTSVSSTFETQLGTVFTLTSEKSSQSIISQVNRTTSSISATILPKASTNDNGVVSKNHGSTVAMAILYSITGILASSFLFIIVSGAIRVHKHPERYGLVAVNSGYDPTIGPNDGSGGGGFGSVQYTNRARGLARAVLDSIPLVRFQVGNGGERDGSDISIHSKEENIGIENISKSKQAQEKSKTKTEIQINQEETVTNPHHHEIGTLIGTLEDQDCPICFEGFKDGDILRILPCKHQFHALCVDPWLLNSSTLCPLCRVDLSLEAGDETNRTNNNLNIPPDYEVEISLFNRLLDIWNAQLLPREARRVALARFHEEAEVRRQLRSRQRNSFDEQNRRRWTDFVDSRRLLYQIRRRRDVSTLAPVETAATDSPATVAPVETTVTASAVDDNATPGIPATDSVDSSEPPGLSNESTNNSTVSLPTAISKDNDTTDTPTVNIAHSDAIQSPTVISSTDPSDVPSETESSSKIH